MKEALEPLPQDSGQTLMTPCVGFQTTAVSTQLNNLVLS
jgi:hypothetical protein